MEHVLVLGASNNPDRYSYQALKLLKEYNHQVYPVNPKEKEVLGQKCFSDLNSIPHQIDTVTVYLNPKLSNEYLNQLLNLKPKRIIFNPGSENAELQKKLEASGISTTEACTLVLLKTNQF